MKINKSDDKASVLFKYAISILNDECPPESKTHLCDYNCEFWEEICLACWRKNLHSVFATGEGTKWRI